MRGTAQIGDVSGDDVVPPMHVFDCQLSIVTIQSVESIQCVRTVQCDLNEWAGPDAAILELTIRWTGFLDPLWSLPLNTPLAFVHTAQCTPSMYKKQHTLNHGP